MSEAFQLRADNSDFYGETTTASYLYTVPEQLAPESIIVPAKYDDEGNIVYPCIDLATEKMPNGQSVASFFERSLESSRTSTAMAKHAIDAARLSYESRL